LNEFFFLSGWRQAVKDIFCKGIVFPSQGSIYVGMGGRSGVFLSLSFSEYISIFPEAVGNGLFSGSFISFSKAITGLSVLTLNIPSF